MEPVITIEGEFLPNEDTAYLEYVKKVYGRTPEKLHIRVCGDEVELAIRFAPVPFQRLRRITGYLVGDMGRWNNGKRAEERDRVKHGREDTE